MNEEYRISLPGLLTGNSPVRRSDGESGRKIPVKGYLIPEGLHVYRKTVSRGNSTPAGVAQPVVSYRFYKHLMPVASGRNGKNLSWMMLHFAFSADRRTEILTGNTAQVTMQVTAQDTAQVTAHDMRKLGDRFTGK